MHKLTCDIGTLPTEGITLHIFSSFPNADTNIIVLITLRVSCSW